MRNRFIVVALLACMLMPSVAEAKQVKVKRVAHGVIFRSVRKYHPRLRVKTLTIKRYRVDDIRAVLGSGELPGWERTSSIARRYRAVAAINGDYGRRSGRPVMAFAHAGNLRQTPLLWGRNFAVAPGQRKSHIGHPRMRVWMNVAGRQIKVARLNNGGPYGNGFAMFDRSGGHLERPPKRSCSVRLMPVGIPRPVTETGGVVTRHRVERVSCRRGRLFPGDGRVISARWTTRKAAMIRNMRRGMIVGLGWSMGWGPVREAIGGNPTLIEAGRIVVGRSSDPFFARHPRTGVGITKRGKVIFATVDGRQRRSRGMTLLGFARLFRKLGARWALNLDGGGSTTMVVRGKVVNRPSDGRERPVSSALVVLGPKSTKRKSHKGNRHSGAGAWKAAAADPASVGGLAMQFDQGQLPGDLAAAARRARRSLQGK